MRNGQNKRMRGRNNNNNHNHHHRKNQNPLTRVYESNGPDVKIRGTASHVAEKYMQLARDATSSGDPVTAENYHQHAEHYLRLIAAAQEQFRQQNPHYRPEGEVREDNSGDDSFDDSDDMGQQPQPGQQSFGNQQPYPSSEPQPYGGQQAPQQQHRPQYQQHHQQHRPQHQQHQPHQPQQNHQPHQQHHQQPQPQNPQPQHQPPQVNNDGNDVERLPSFITGGQPQQNPGQNGYDNQGGSGDRYGMHRRRRRHRGPHRPDLQGGQGSGGDAPDNRRPDND